MVCQDFKGHHQDCFHERSRDGDEGRWSSFNVALGTPAQNIRMLISTSYSTIWTVLPQPNSQCGGANCIDGAGRVFEPRSSSSWRPYGSDPHENNTCVVGTDEVRIGSAENTSGPLLRAQSIVGCHTTIPSSTGMLGLSPFLSSNSTSANSSWGVLNSLKSNKLIPSMSYSYGVGAAYRNAPGSLVLGGFDESKSEPDRASFSLNNNPDQRMVIRIQDITTKVGPISTRVMSRPAISANIDSTVIDMMLPTADCTTFERTFMLTYEEKLDMYFVNESVHQELLQKRASVTLTIGDKGMGEQTVNITVPYAAFDLGTSSLPRGTARRFPLRRAQNANLPTLGRVFLQEAYLTVDWESGTFSVSQARFDGPEKIVPIYPSSGDLVVHAPKMTMTPSTSNAPPSPTVPVKSSTVTPVIRHSGGTTTPTGSSSPAAVPSPSPSLSKGAIAAVVLGPTGALAVLLCLLICIRRHMNRPTDRKSRYMQRISSTSTLTSMREFSTLVPYLPSPPRPTRTISSPELFISSSGFTAESPEEPTPDANTQGLSEKNSVEGAINGITRRPPPPLEEHPLFKSRPASPLLPPCARPHSSFANNYTLSPRFFETERSSTLSTITESPSVSVYTVFSQQDRPDSAELLQCKPLDITRRRTSMPTATTARDSSEYWDRFFLPTCEQRAGRGRRASPTRNNEVNALHQS